MNKLSKMSQNGIEAALSKGSSPHRPRHQITRSISELSSPIRLHRHHSNRAGKDRDKERDTTHNQRLGDPFIPSQLEPGRLSLDASRPERGMTPSNLSPDASRRTSIHRASNDDGGGNNSLAALVVSSSAALVATPAPAAPSGVSANRTTPSSNMTKQEENIRERYMAAARERSVEVLTEIDLTRIPLTLFPFLANSGLKTSLSSLQSVSTATTRRLDDAYYSVLEKLGALQSTIVALKDLATLSQATNSSFETDSEELVTEVSAQLDGYQGQFEDQQRRIEALQTRIYAGRDKIGALSERVDAVKEQIETWEKADKEWQERTRRRLKAFWVLTSVVAVAVLVGMIFVNSGSQVVLEGQSVVGRGGESGDGSSGSNASSKDGGALGSLGKGILESLSSLSGGAIPSRSNTDDPNRLEVEESQNGSKGDESTETSDALRVLDEL